MLSRIAPAALATALITLVPAIVFAEQADPATVGRGQREASAPKLENSFEVAASIGYGADLSESINRWGLGVGGALGYNIERFYVGARFVYQFGDTYWVTPSDAPPTKVDAALREIVAEVGYDFPIYDALTLRPSLLVGFAHYDVIDAVIHFDSSSLNAPGRSTDRWMVSPGLTAIYDLADKVFVGVDLRLSVVNFSESILGFVAFANVGLRI
jgi:hypothetical protein